MKTLKKTISIFICILIAFCIFSACKKNENEPVQETTAEAETTALPAAEKSITLGYFESKGFNPYKTDSPLNRNLLTLIYDSLFIVEDGYTVSPLIAESFTNDGNLLTVTIKDELYFSDGSLVDPSDVVYSFNMAKDNSFYGKDSQM